MISYIFIINDRKNIPELFVRLESVMNEAVWVGVSSSPECEREIKKKLDEIEIKYNLIVNTEVFSDYYKIDQFLPYIKNGWTYVHEIGQPFRDDVNSKVKKFIEGGGKFGLIADEHEAINDTCFYSLIYKMLRGNRPEPNQMINFYDKVEREDPAMVKKWSDLNELRND